MSAASYVYTSMGQKVLADWTTLFYQIEDIRRKMETSEGEDLDRLLGEQAYLCRVIAKIEEEADVPKEYRT
jgi:hypothetical protein